MFHYPEVSTGRERCWTRAMGGKEERKEIGTQEVRETQACLPKAGVQMYAVTCTGCPCTG